jgi:hypothetical protein
MLAVRGLVRTHEMEVIMSWRLLGACAALLWLSSAALAEKRLALVIGNSAYRSVVALPNPANDARAMADFLTTAGFEVVAAPDLTQADMRQSVQSFAAKAAESGPDTVAMVYYAGHGVQIDGENFLVPVDAVIQRETDVAMQAVRLLDVMNALAAAPSRVRIVILDACRNNPFSQIRQTTGRGLAMVDAPTGTIISYSTAPGFEAEDGSGDHSPFTAALLDAAKEPGLPIERAFKNVRLAVHRATAGRQTPWESSSLTGDFSFHGVASSASTPSASLQPVVAKPTVPAAGTKTSTQTGDARARVRPAAVWRKQIKALPPDEAFDLVLADDSIEGYVEYLAIHPTAATSGRARALLERRREMTAWHDAVALNSTASFEAFIARYPNSDLAATSQRLLERARTRSLTASLIPDNACPAPLPLPEIRGQRQRRGEKRNTEKRHADKRDTKRARDRDRPETVETEPPSGMQGPAEGPPVTIGIGVFGGRMRGPGMGPGRPTMDPIRTPRTPNSLR